MNVSDNKMPISEISSIVFSFRDQKKKKDAKRTFFPVRC